MASEPTIFLITCIVSLAMTALIREVAPLLRFTDDPDGHRKLHGYATPLGGGVAVFLTSSLVLGTLFIVPNPFRENLWTNLPELPGFWLACALIVMVGLIDDRVGLRGRDKLLGQIVAVSILLWNGLIIHKIGLFGFEINLGLLAVPVTLFWMLGAINALNLLDGIDGLATMLGIILSCTIAIMAAMTGHSAVAIVAMVFTGALLGFMRFNFPPATIFLGDAGSMLIGLVVGALAIHASLKGPGTVLLAAPLAVWSIPIFDVVAAILRRKLTGRSIYTTDRGHLHHRLLSLLGSNRRVLGWLAVCCALTSVATLVGVFLESDLIAFLTCAAVVIIFIATGAFGRVELLLVSNKLRKFSRMLVPRSSKRPRVHKTSIQLQGSRRWDMLWTEFTDTIESLPVYELRLDVNLPLVEESYHASWERPGRVNEEQCWQISLPLVAGDNPVGRLVVLGERDGTSTRAVIGQLLEFIESFETHLRNLTEQTTREEPIDSHEEAPSVVSSDVHEPSGHVLAAKHPR